jgi:hypothetical protein
VSDGKKCTEFFVLLRHGADPRTDDSISYAKSAIENANSQWATFEDSDIDSGARRVLELISKYHPDLSLE